MYFSHNFVLCEMSGCKAADWWEPSSARQCRCDCESEFETGNQTRMGKWVFCQSVNQLISPAVP